MKDLKHLIFFEKLLENADNELVRQAQDEGGIALGYTYEVGSVLYQDYDSYEDCYDVEFLDVNGGYHHWKSQFDGGRIIPKN